MADESTLGSVDVSMVGDVGYLADIMLDGRAYSRYNIRQQVATKSGLYQMPAAGPVGTPARIVRLHAPVSSKIVTWVIERLCLSGEKPLLPHWDTEDANEVCIYAEVRIDSPIIQPGGYLFLWRVAGEYHYVSASAGRTAIGGGATPACIFSPQNFGIGEGDFSKEFIRSISQSQGVAFQGAVFDPGMLI